MSNSSLIGLLCGIVGLLLVSAFFSGSETAMMSLNRYRLRHQARKGNFSAQRLLSLLSRPDRLLGVILLGNTFANLFMSSMATLLVSHYYGDSGVGVVVATMGLAVLVLIFAETAPKTLAALRPHRFARRVGFLLFILLRCLYPLVWLITYCANTFLKLFGVRVCQAPEDALTSEELGSVVREASGQLSGQHQKMLLSILDLEKDRKSVV